MTNYFQLALVPYAGLFEEASKFIVMIYRVGCVSTIYSTSHSYIRKNLW